MKKLDNNFYQMLIRITATVVLAILLGFLLAHFFPAPKDNPEDKNVLAWIIPALIALGLIYWIVISFFKDKDVKNSYYVNKYHDIFFKGTIIFAISLVVLSISYSVLMYLEQKNIFAIVGLLMLVIWLAVFMIYFVWAVYYYNINFGISDGEWAEIAEAKRQGREMELENPALQIREPKYNPYRSQTFGLPPGTVRGMIAFTLLFGGISLLVASMGTEEIDPQLMQLRIQQFEFFETAFLMMIAFYFGDRSLKYFRERWKNPNQVDTIQDPTKVNTQSPTSNPDAIPPSTLGFDDTIAEDDMAFVEEDREFGLSNQEVGSSPSSITDLKNTLINFSSEPVGLASAPGFVQIQDNANNKILNDDQLMDSLEELAEKNDIILSLPVVKAVIEVESAGRGHLKNGNAKILFEGHLFWKLLKKNGKSDVELEQLQKSNKDILYKSWTKAFYKGGMGEYDRLERAKKIDEKLAVYSASWGLFQILGENLEHYIKSRIFIEGDELKTKIGNEEDLYTSWMDFEAKQHDHEKYHYLDFMAFIMTKRFKNKALIDYISENPNSPGKYDWASFAHAYNGSGYKLNKYDIKLQAAYEKYKKIHQ